MFFYFLGDLTGEFLMGEMGENWLLAGVSGDLRLLVSLSKLDVVSMWMLASGAVAFFTGDTGVFLQHRMQNI